MTTTVYGSHGTIDIDPETGDVIEVRLGKGPDIDTHYTQILQFDLAEWHQRYPDEALPDNLDILDLGYWYTNHKQRMYEPPDEEARRLMAGSGGVIGGVLHPKKEGAAYPVTPTEVIE